MSAQKEYSTRHSPILACVFPATFPSSPPQQRARTTRQCMTRQAKKWFRFQPPQSQERVIAEAKAALKKFGKTFKDLAEYDRSQQKPSWVERFIKWQRTFHDETGYFPTDKDYISLITRLREQSYKEGRADEKVKPNSGDNCEVDWCSTCEVEYCNFHCRHNCAARTGEGKDL